MSALAQLDCVYAPVQVKQLAAEVVAHLRETVGADALLEVFNAARQSVTSLRAERRRQTAVKVSRVNAAGRLDVFDGDIGICMERTRQRELPCAHLHHHM